MGAVPRGRRLLSADAGSEGAFFGELYLRSTLPFLSPATTAREVRYLEHAFRDLAVPGPVVDLGCGHGRHAAALEREGCLAGRVLGLELDALSLERRLPGFPAVRADLRALPFGTRRLAGAYAWYSSLFVFSDAEHVALLAEIARCVRPGGRLVLHTVPFERLERAPEASFRTQLPDGGMLEETSRFDPESGRDRALRRLVLPGGRTLAASYAVRYYPVGVLTHLLQAAGFSVCWVHGGLSGEALAAESTDLILGAERIYGRDR